MAARASSSLFEGPRKFTLVSANHTNWFAAKCRMKDCPLAGSPFECPFHQPCASVGAEDWDDVSVPEEEESHG